MITKSSKQLLEISSLDLPPSGGIRYLHMKIALAIFLSALMALSGSFAHAAAAEAHAAAAEAQASQHHEMMSGEHDFREPASSNEAHDQGVVCCEAHCAIAYGYLTPVVCQTEKDTYADRHAVQKGDAVDVLPSSFDPPPPRT